MYLNYDKFFFTFLKSIIKHYIKKYTIYKIQLILTLREIKLDSKYNYKKTDKITCFSKIV